LNSTDQFQAKMLMHLGKIHVWKVRRQKVQRS
jgi:hypothetical protein